MPKKEKTPEEIKAIVETEVRAFNIMVWSWHDNMIQDLVLRLGKPRSEVEDMVAEAINAKVG